MADDCRACITSRGQPRLERKSYLRSVVDDLRSHLGEHAPVSVGEAHRFMYAAAPGAAEQADQLARVVLAQPT